jgi:hypothetical protein
MIKQRITERQFARFFLELPFQGLPSGQSKIPAHQLEGERLPVTGPAGISTKLCATQPCESHCMLCGPMLNP